MSELTLYVAGMTCRRCVREVTARLRDVAGVETVAADASRCHVRLSGSMTFPDVVRALAGTTYRPEIARDIAQGTANDPANGPADGGAKGAVSSAVNRDGTEAGQGAP